MLENFTDKAKQAIELSQAETRRMGHNLVGTEFLLLGLLAQGTGIAVQILREMQINLKDTRREVEKIIGRGCEFVSAEIPLAPKVKRILEQSIQESNYLENNYVGPEHILLALISDRESVAVQVLEKLGADLVKTRERLLQIFQEIPTFSINKASKNSGLHPSENQTVNLNKFATNLTKLAAIGQLEPVVGRHQEIERVIQILGRRNKNNPVLVGEAGVGKTAIAEGLALRIVNLDVPDILINKQVFSLDLGLLVAGTRYRGEFEDRLQAIVSEIREARNIILVIDEIHNLIGTGTLQGSMDAANLLKPALTKGDLQCVGATTLDEYRKYIEKDPTLERRFQAVIVEEPSITDTIDILYGLREGYEYHHKVKISNQALEAAVKLSHRYICDRYLPDKAIDLIDEAGSRIRLKKLKVSIKTQLRQELPQVIKEKEAAVKAQNFEKARKLRDRELQIEDQLRAIVNNKYFLPPNPDDIPVVEPEDIAQIVAAWTGIPVNKITESEAELLLNLEDKLHQRIIGQKPAVTAVASAIRRARVGLKNPNRPIASFIFSGPTGVGKTELAKTLAAAIFASEKAMIRLDMSEYMAIENLSKLIGTSPGLAGHEEGGQLTEAVRRRPYTVILFDEIEKAHPDIFNLMLQLLEEGRLTDANGREVDFKNTLIIMTSNIGSKVIDKNGEGIGFEFNDNEAQAKYNRIRHLVNQEIKQYFRPELLNRLDDIIVFSPLNFEEVKQIADLMVRDIANRLNEHKIQLEVTENFKHQLLLAGYHPIYGARPLRRAIMRLLEDNLAEAMLSGVIQDGDTALVDITVDGQVKIIKSNPRREFAISSIS